MRYLWSRLIIFFLLVEGLLFAVYYTYGPRGINVLYELENIKTIAQSDIKNIEQKNNDLRDHIEEWKSDMFLQEKFAREKLSLQKENEIIYFR